MYLRKLRKRRTCVSLGSRQRMCEALEQPKPSHMSSWSSYPLPPIVPQREQLPVLKGRPIKPENIPQTSNRKDTSVNIVGKRSTGFRADGQKTSKDKKKKNTKSSQRTAITQGKIQEMPCDSTVVTATAVAALYHPKNNQRKQGTIDPCTRLSTTTTTNYSHETPVLRSHVLSTRSTEMPFAWLALRMHSACELSLSSPWYFHFHSHEKKKKIGRMVNM